MHTRYTVVVLVACCLLLEIFTRLGLAEDKLLLVHDGQTRCVIVRGRDDQYAGGRLKRWLADVSGAEVDLLEAGKDSLPDEGLVVLIGSQASNPLIKRLCSEIGMQVASENLTAQGYCARTVRRENRDWLILAGGGRTGAIYAVSDMIHWQLDHVGRDVWTSECETRQVPRIKYRWFWNWDHRMDWGGPGKVGQVMGGGGTFTKKPEAFLIDFKNCIDYMADHKFNGLILWGFLRDTHGGIAATQELCRYAAERGVCILPGVGTSGYAGYYFEGEHPLNADTWLGQHPELRSLDAQGKPRNAPCPSNKANQQWLDEGAEWLFENFEIGGVNLEMGDFFVCYCDACKRARVAIPSDEPDYYKDMAISHRVTLRTMRDLAPDAWLSYATYTGYTAGMTSNPPLFLSMIPDDAICQWTLTSMAGRWPAGVKPMAKHNVGYLHWCNASTHTQDDFYLQRIHDICRNASVAGFEGLDTYGELSPERPNVEIAYLAWEAFTWNPDMTVEQFVDQRLGRLYGGRKAAHVLLDIIPLVRTAKCREDPEHCRQARELAEQAKQLASPDGHEHWNKLIAYLERHEQAAREQLAALRQAEATTRQGRRIELASVQVSDEDRAKRWIGANAIDGNVKEPEGYWLTQRTTPKSAWLELALAQPAKINRIALFHQLNPGHYRSLDYNIHIRSDGLWKQVATVKDNTKAGWVAHTFADVVTDAVRLDITRSAYNARMGIGEIELRYVEVRVQPDRTNSEKPRNR